MANPFGPKIPDEVENYLAGLHPSGRNWISVDELMLHGNHLPFFEEESNTSALDLESDFEELLGEFTPDAEGALQILEEKGDLSLEQVARINGTELKESKGSKGQDYVVNWTVEDMVDPRIARRFKVQGSRKVHDVKAKKFRVQAPCLDGLTEDQILMAERKHRSAEFRLNKGRKDRGGISGKQLDSLRRGMKGTVVTDTYRNPVFRRGNNIFERELHNGKRFDHVDYESDFNARRRVVRKLDSRLAQLVAGSYSEIPKGVASYDDSLTHSYNTRRTRNGTSKTPKSKNLKPYEVFAAELSERYDQFVSRITKLYMDSNTEPIAKDLIESNASSLGLKQLGDISELVGGDVDLSFDFEWTHSDWSSTRYEILTYLAPRVPADAEAYVTIHEFGKETDSYKIGKGFSFGTSDLPSDVDGRMEFSFKQGNDVFGISLHLQKEKLTESQIECGWTEKDRSYTIIATPMHNHN
ncbi:hypothetical protein ISS07_03980 [Candidatus Woesearchaeota archaeon]|nr:hypothetical protein [Candidatus Woesearchaeota archaeon]